MKYTAATVANLATIRTDCTPAVIRDIWKAPAVDLDAWPATRDWYRACWHKPKERELKRAAVNEAAGFHGVEYLGTHRRTGESVYYCNTGDTYAGTVAFIGRRLIVTTMGDLIERGTVRERAQ